MTEPTPSAVPTQAEPTDVSLSTLPRQPAPVLPELQRLDRYLVLSKLGQGGMGVVYAAYDEQLDRKVAIKLLRTRGGGEAQQRLVREAQALARLSHPNVVQVYEIGQRGEQAFIVMEFVDGPTLRTWLQQSPRTPRAIVDVLRAAGRGLAAAHHKGLVHRDFKPDNVMIASDGRVLVMDFGLAHARLGQGRADADDVAETDAPTAGELDSLSADLTETGALMGTPAYMAPEQFLTGQTDARSDQFSFCVTLWEALYGQRPFAGESLAALSLAITSGERREPPREREVPSWLRRLLERGLAIEPEQRWPSMDRLVDALGYDPTRTRWGIAALAGTLSLTAGLLIGAHLQDRAAKAEQQAACAAEGEVIREVWNPEVEARLAQRFADTELGYAADTWAATRARLVEYADGWARLQTDNCEQSTLAGTRPPEQRRRVDACLDEARSSFTAFIEVLAEIDDVDLGHAPTVAARLPGLDGCADPRRLAGRLEPPEDPTTRAEVAAVRAKLARARLLQYAGRAAQARDETKPLVGEAEAIGWTPLLAEVHHEIARSHSYDNEYEAAIAAAERAFELATESGHDLVALRAAIGLVEELDPDHARRRLWGRIALALGRRLDIGGSVDEAGLFTALGDLAYHASEFDEAARWHRQALDLRRALFGPVHPDTATSLNNLGNVLAARGEIEPALAALREAEGIWARFVGPRHPDVGRAQLTIATTLYRAGQLEQAREAFERARPICAEQPGKQPLAALENGLGNVEYELGNYDEAMAHFEAAERYWRSSLGPDHYLVGVALTSIGDVQRDRGQPELARATLERAVAQIAGTLGEGHVDLVHPLHSLALALQDLGRHDEALAILARALPLVEGTYGPEDPDVGVNLFWQARSRWALGDQGEARRLAERARELLAPIDSPFLPDLEAWLAAHPDP